MKHYERKYKTLSLIQHGCCYNCGRPVGEHGQIDHILPKHRADTNRNPEWIDELFNLRILCPDCHLNKRPKGFSKLDEEKINESLKTGDWRWIEDEKLKKHIRNTLRMRQAWKFLLGEYQDDWELWKEKEDNHGI